MKAIKNSLRLLCFTGLLFLNFKAKSQCTTICGTVTAKGTITVSPVANYTLATTYSFVTSSGVNSITAGALSVSVGNVGESNALFNGVTIPAGQTINIMIPNSKLPAYTYNCQTSTLTVLVNR